MQKVFVKIPGVERPYAIIGRYLFEDERFYVVDDGGIRKKILWANILYIEDVSDTTTFDETPIATDAIVEEAKREKDTSVNVFFVGHVNETFKIDNVPDSLFDSQNWTPDLAKLVFSNKQIRAFMGNFIVMKADVQGRNITITTAATNGAPDSVLSPPTMNPEVEQKIAVLQNKAQIFGGIGSLLKNAMGGPKFERPATTYDTDFSMPASPFETPVSMLPTPKDGEPDGNL